MWYKIFIGILLISELSFAGTRDPSVSDSKHIAYGHDFKYVGKLLGINEDGTEFFASCVAIDDNHIITAAHVVTKVKSCKFILDNREFCITDVVLNKSYDDNNFGIGDLAIGYSKVSFDLDFYPELYDEDDEVGKICSISGYGTYGTFVTGANLWDGQRRAGSNMIDTTIKDLLICSASRYGDSKRTSLEFIIASGDSGGGLFIGNKLAGINSCIMASKKSPESKYGEESGHTRISRYIGWINEIRKK